MGIGTPGSDPTESPLKGLQGQAFVDYLLQHPEELTRETYLRADEILTSGSSGRRGFLNNFLILMPPKRYAVIRNHLAMVIPEDDHTGFVEAMDTTDENKLFAFAEKYGATASGIDFRKYFEDFDKVTAETNLTEYVRSIDIRSLNTRENILEAQIRILPIYIKMRQLGYSHDILTFAG